MNRPTKAFALALIGGSASTVSPTLPLVYLYRSLIFPDVSVGLVIVLLSILLHEMPERYLTFGAAIATLSAAGAISSVILIGIDGGSIINPLSYILYAPAVGSTLSFLGGIAALTWKPSPENKTT